MKNLNRMIKFMCVCLASVLLCMANESVHDEIRGDGPSAGIRTSVSYSSDYADFSFTSSAVQCNAPRNTTSTNSLRTSYQTHRHNTGKSARTGFTMIKSGKSMNEYSTSLFYKSIVNFPSGMNENNHRLISLGKLII